MADPSDIINQLLASQNPDPTQYTDFNSQYAQAMRDIARTRAGLADTQNRTTTRLNEDYTKGIDTFQRGRDDSISSLMDYLATNGNLRSGANVAQQGKINEEFLRNITDLAQSRTRAVEDLVSQITNANQGLMGREEGLNFQKAQADAQAGLANAQTQASLLANSQPVYQPDGTYQSPAGTIAPTPAQVPVTQTSGAPIVDRTPIQNAAYRRLIK